LKEGLKMQIRKQFKGYMNYGDINYMDHGAKFIKQLKNDECYIVSINPNYNYETEKTEYLIDYCILDTSDSWIDKKAVKEYADIKNDDKKDLACGVVDYYGFYNITGNESEKTESIKAAYSRLLQLINRE
jgi:hypothetical protein